MLECLCVFFVGWPGYIGYSEDTRTPKVVVILYGEIMYSNIFLCSLMRNPVTHKQHYRLYVIYRLPQVKVLDFRKIKQKV